MQNPITVKKIEKEYQRSIQQQIVKGNALTADAMIDLSMKLFQDVKAKGVSTDETDNDMLLFQYGIYNWGDENGKHFSFEIARQLIIDKNQDFYQLRLTFIYDPESFENCVSYNC